MRISPLFLLAGTIATVAARPLPPDEDDYTMAVKINLTPEECEQKFRELKAPEFNPTQQAIFDAMAESTNIAVRENDPLRAKDELARKMVPIKCEQKEEFGKLFKEMARKYKFSAPFITFRQAEVRKWVKFLQELNPDELNPSAEPVRPKVAEKHDTRLPRPKTKKQNPKYRTKPRQKVSNI